MTLCTSGVGHKVNETIIVFLLQCRVKYNHDDILQFALQVPVMCLSLQEVEFVKVACNQDSKEQFITLTSLLAVLYFVDKRKLVGLLAI